MVAGDPRLWVGHGVSQLYSAGIALVSGFAPQGAADSILWGGCSLLMGCCGRKTKKIDRATSTQATNVETLCGIAISCHGFVSRITANRCPPIPRDAKT
jgi:hypothetical protein